MADKQPRAQRRPRSKRFAGETKDVFTRVDMEMYEQFDALRALVEPEPSVSALLAHLMKKYIQENAHKLKKK